MAYLCCDLGGTICQWGIFDPELDCFILTDHHRNEEHEDFYEMLDKFLLRYSEERPDSQKITNATIAVAGPTDYRSVKVTNIEGWIITIEGINENLKAFGHEQFSSLINDFEALGYGILYLQDNEFSQNDFIEIHGRMKTRPARIGEERGDRSLVCGPGTGLGAACMVDGLTKDGFPFVFSTEAGHHTLAPETTGQLRLITDDGRALEMQSYEEVLSHSGLRNLYNFYRRKDFELDTDYQISAYEILLAANGKSDFAAQAAREIYCEILANFCGNLVLTFNCDKSVYLWGGVLKNIPEELLRAKFARFYGDNRREHAGRTNRVPVVKLINSQIPLYGCVSRSKYENLFLK